MLAVKEMRKKGKHLVRSPLVQPHFVLTPPCFSAYLPQMESLLAKLQSFLAQSFPALQITFRVIFVIIQSLVPPGGIS